MHLDYEDFETRMESRILLGYLGLVNQLTDVCFLLPTPWSEADSDYAPVYCHRA